jgi:hypothetical protein
MPDTRSRNLSALVSAFVIFLTAATLHAAAPQITNISPTRGPIGGGTIVVITGSGFTGATQVTFGAANATSFSVQSDTSIQATTPAGAAGVVDVTVVTPEGSVTLAEGFGYGSIPIANADTYTTPFNASVTVGSPGVLANDDPNGGGGWVAALGENVTKGTLNFAADGGFTYTPNTGFAGTDKFTYRSQNGTGFSSYATVTITVAAPLAPLPPTGLYASEIRGNRLTLRFTAPPVGLTPTAYLIEGGAVPGSVAASIVIPPTPLATIDAPTGSFYVRVRTQSGALISEPSNEILIFVNVPALPSAPDHFTTTVVGDTLSLAWRPTFAGGEPASFVLDVSGAAVASLPVGNGNGATFAGVPAGTYTLSLRALNPLGSSFPSAPVTVSVPDTCSALPLAPVNFLAYKAGSTVHLIWDPAASGGAPASYVVNVSGAIAGAFPTTGRSLSGTVGAGTYSFSVTAINACGAGPATSVQTLTIP